MNERESMGEPSGPRVRSWAGPTWKGRFLALRGRWPWQYAGAVLLVAAGLLLAQLLSPLVRSLPSPLFLGIVVVSTWWGGLGAGLASAVLSALAVDYFFVPPLYTIEFNEDHIARLSVFVGIGLLISWLNQSLKDARRRAEDHAAEARTALAEQASAERALRASEATARSQREEIESIYQSAPIGLCVLDASLRLVRLNAHFAKLDGWPLDEHRGRLLGEVFPALLPARDQLQRVLVSGEPILDMEVSGETHAGGGAARTWVQSWTPLRDHAGQVSGINVVVQDVTDARRIADELRQANRVKDNFLSTLSHELRTPLNTILGWSQMLLSGAVTGDRAQRAMESIDRAARAQVALVDDVLDLSRAVSGKLTLRHQAVDLGAVIEHAVDAVSPGAQAKQIRLSRDLPAPATVIGDPDRLQQVFGNLLANAVKFTPAGGRVHVLLEEDGPDVVVRVQDTGAGIAPAFLPRVFEPFTQADSSSTREHGGLGLGLSIVRHLVELHGGSVSASSPGEHRGATFMVRLPARREVQQAGPAAPLAAPGGSALRLPRGVRVLVVDDHREARELLQEVLGESGARVVSVPDSESALAELQSREVDLLVSDLGMPRVDGFELIRRVRSLPGRNRAVPAIALSAYGREEDRARALAGGYQRHVCKPILPAEFIRVVAVVLQEAPPAGEAGSVGPPDAGYLACRA